MNKLAVEFVRHTLLHNPKANTFGEIYDALSRAACTRSFHNLGYLELAQVGISFSLLNIADLECLIFEAQKSDPDQPDNARFSPLLHLAEKEGLIVEMQKPPRESLAYSAG